MVLGARLFYKLNELLVHVLKRWLLWHKKFCAIGFKTKLTHLSRVHTDLSQRTVRVTQVSDLIPMGFKQKEETNGYNREVDEMMEE